MMLRSWLGIALVLALLGSPFDARAFFITVVGSASICGGPSPWPSR